MPLRVLMAHNYYQHPGGEDESFGAEAAMLERDGHEVTRFVVRSSQVLEHSRLRLAANTLWNKATYRDIADVVRGQKYDVAHFQNTFPVLSPSVYYAARREGIPIIQSMRNYRLSCVNGMHFRDNEVCTDCVGASAPWRGVLHGCYRDSRAASAVVASMVAVHKLRRTFTDVVNAYIAVSGAVRDVLVASGIPADKVFVKPNTVVPDPGESKAARSFAVFVGRLSAEKGLVTLLDAWETTVDPPELLIIGDGPLAELVQRRSSPKIHLLGQLPLSQTLEVLGQARFVVVPSRWMEPFGRVVVEAFAKGTPVLAGRTGGLAEIVDHGHTGRLFDPNSVADLVEQIGWFMRNIDSAKEMGKQARLEYERRYAPDVNSHQLVAIYEEVMKRGIHA